VVMSSPTGWHSFPLAVFIEAILLVTFLRLPPSLLGVCSICLSCLASGEHYSIGAGWIGCLDCWLIRLLTYNIKSVGSGEGYFIFSTPFAASSELVEYVSDTKRAVEVSYTFGSLWNIV
jgi:hypothetical protein